MSAFGHVSATVQRRHPASLLLVGLPLLAALLGAVLALAFGKPAAKQAARGGSGGGLDRRRRLRRRPARHAARGWTPTRTGPKIPGFHGAHAAFARS